MRPSLIMIRRRELKGMFRLTLKVRIELAIELVLP